MHDSKDSTTTLGYWPIRGLAEPIRLVLEYAGQTYKDHKYSDDWFGKDKFALGLPFPNLPYLISGDVKISQSEAILRHLGRKHGLMGTTEAEHIAVDVLIGEAGDLGRNYSRLCYSPDFEKLKPDFLKDLPKKLKQFEDYLTHDFFVRKTPTIADFLLFEIFDVHVALSPTCLDEFPKLKAFRHRITELPKIKAYRTSSRFAAHPINGSSAFFK
eukprot:TRINITY_DN1406_c0_g1_i3.p1 TRINITY_DN1406_c0_g1~~TRINITY_DN1406_c0_g1_i3.p1  ORF type:complete len:222 (-),score=50.76 TRINITY_DN1406_c0_g1_i3:76-717(-)